MSIISARTFWVPVMMTTLVATFFAALLERGGRQHMKLLQEQTRLEQRLARLKAQNRRLRIERTELLTDLGAVERAAREELNLVASGESIVVAEAVPPPPVPPVPAPRMGPVERVTTMPQFTQRVTLGALAASAVLFLLWNSLAMAWRRATQDPATPRPQIAKLQESDPSRKNAA